MLVADDDIPLAESMKLNLEDTGNFEVRVETQSTAALATARDFQPEVILLDIVMPGLDGGDVTALLQADPLLCDVPIIIVTALVANSEAGSTMGSVVALTSHPAACSPLGKQLPILARYLSRAQRRTGASDRLFSCRQNSRGLRED